MCRWTIRLELRYHERHSNQMPRNSLKQLPVFWFLHSREFSRESFLSVMFGSFCSRNFHSSERGSAFFFLIMKKRPKQINLAQSSQCALLSRFRPIWLFVTPWTIVPQAPLFMEFSRKEYWSGTSFPSPRGSSQPRDWTWVFCIAGRFFTVWATREAH